MAVGCVLIGWWTTDFFLFQSKYQKIKIKSVIRTLVKANSCLELELTGHLAQFELWLIRGIFRILLMFYAENCQTRAFAPPA